MGRFSKRDSTPKDAGLPYEDSHPRTIHTADLDAANARMVEDHREACSTVSGNMLLPLAEMEQRGKELNQLIDTMRTKGYELDIPGMDEPDRPWTFYRRGR